MDKVYRPIKPKKEDLIKVYDVFNEIFKGKDMFYTTEEMKKLSKEKIALWVKLRVWTFLRNWWT